MSFNFDIAPFYDDFEAPNGADVNNYMRILFRPGYAVQGRELTQIQSILQKQIERLGDFVLQDGSPVSGGHISLDTTPTAIKLQPQFSNTDIILSNFLINNQPTLITSVSANPNSVAAMVVATDSTQSNPTLVIKYLTANTFQNGDTIQVATGIQSQATLISNAAFNPASTVSIDNGIFYRGGFFVNVQPQTITLDSTTNQPSYRVGLTISENIINEAEDANLLDPAQGSFNYQAPGAWRYQYNLVLDKRSLTSTDDSAFFELLRVESGLITQQIEYPILGDIDATLARRTFDEAGDFTVSPFAISVAPDGGNANSYLVVTEPGKAYVKGYEFQTIAVQKLSAPKALNTNSITDYGMSLNYGNYLVVTNLQGGNSGFFDLLDYNIVDIHVVPTASINTTDQGTYLNTKMGTARVRNFEFLGLNNWFCYISELSLSPINFTALGGSNNGITFPTHFSQATNAYANVVVQVNTGGVLDQRTILSYNTGNSVATLSSNLSIPANSTSNVYLLFGIKDSEALVNAPAVFTGNVFYQQNTIAGINSAMDIAVAGKDAGANTLLQETNFNTLIFPLPQSYIAQNTIVNVSFTHRKNLYNQTFTSGNLTIGSGTGLGTGETFGFGFTNQLLPDQTANNNFIVAVRNKQSSNLSNGQLINFNVGTVAGGNGVFQVSNNQVTITVFDGSGATFTGDVIFTCNVAGANSTAVARRTKSLVGNANTTSLSATDSYLNGAVVIGNTSANIDTANGYIWFTNRAIIPNTPGSNLSLFVHDVVGIQKIFDSGSASFQPNTTNAIDITSRYTFDSGQRDNFYDHGKIILNAGQNPPTGQVVVLLTYYQHDTVQGFFDADSYAAGIYNAGIIPYYNSQKFGSFSLRDSIDFRPTRSAGNTANVQGFTLQGYAIPEPDAPMVLSYQFYLPRIDKLQITKNKVFRFLQGVPAQYPLVPADTDDAMTIYILTIPAFTANVKEIGIQYVENKRYTMRDIGALDSRIQQLEYYSALSQLESQATNETILYKDNVTAKDQYGVIADDFGNFSICDNKNRDLRCFMSQNQLTSYKVQNPFLVGFANANTTGYATSQSGKVYSLSFTETPCLSQNNATSNVPVQPYMFAQYKGTIKLTPETTPHFTPNLQPIVVAPPTSPAKELPPAPTPPATTTLAPYNPAPAPAKPVVSAATPIVDVQDYWFNSYPTGTRAPTRITGYGGVSILGNWYGLPVTRTHTATQTSPPPNLGTSINLQPGAKITTGVPANVASILGKVSL